MNWSPNRLPQSLSEPSLQPVNTAYEPLCDVSLPDYLKHLPNTNALQNNTDPVKAARGRSTYRNNSPHPAQKSAHHNDTMCQPKSSRKRSKSPMKKLFGFGKSASLKDIAAERQTMFATHSERPSQQGGGKSWTNKIRHGFLVGVVPNA